MKVHILVQMRYSPIYITSPKVRKIYSSLKEAKAEAERLSNSPYTRGHSYWVESFTVKDPT